MKSTYNKYRKAFIYFPLYIFRGGQTIRGNLTFQIGRKRNPKRSKIHIKSNYEAASLETKMKRMAQSGFGFWKIVLTTALAVLFFAAFTAVVNAADTYYVATTGDDGIAMEAQGTPGGPFSML